jgi:hypothetical protein
MSESWDMRRIVETHRHLRGSQNEYMATFPSPEDKISRSIYQGLYQPHIGKATVSRTGTLPPPRCGKGPTVVGESVVVLPGSPRDPARRLTGKGSDRESWKTAAVVVEGVTPLRGTRESRVQGQRRQVRRLLISHT